MPRTKPFDDYYNHYEEWFEDNRFAWLSELDAVRYFIPESGRGMEIGVGSGRFAAHLGIGVGVEPSEAMRKLARVRGIDVYDAVAESLPFGDGTFDFALMVTTICFVDDVRTSFTEARRVLKKGGRFIVGFVDRNSDLGRTYEIHKEENVFYRDATFYSTDDVIALLDECGFEKPQAVQTIFGDFRMLTRIEPFTKGYGRGGFVVVCAKNPS
ncbi:MAG: methyltransferase domain-containing protein [Spirochaetes bacterium]|nr:methyltransferase domain-containing protein [Spirochaetota bacterium]